MAVVNYLRQDGNVSLIGLWGRSMGAVTRFCSFTSIFPFVSIFFSRCVIGLCSRGPVAVLRPSHLLIYH